MPERREHFVLALGCLTTPLLGTLVQAVNGLPRALIHALKKRLCALIHTLERSFWPGLHRANRLVVRRLVETKYATITDTSISQ